MKVNIDLTHLEDVINKAFLPLLQDTSRHLVLRGGAGSGKSEFIIQKILIRILKDFNTKKHHFLCIRKTSPAARKSIFRLFLLYIDKWHLGDLCKIHKTNMIIEFTTGSIISTIGLDDSEKLKSIVGVTSGFCEECTELSLEDVQQLNLRIRGITPSYKQIAYLFNPVSKNSWVYKRFFEEDHDNVSLHHSTYKDNRFLDKEYIAELEDLINQNPSAHLIYTRGEWGSLDHIIYSNYRTMRMFPVKECESIIYGLDFGYNVPSALIRIGKKGDEYYLSELLYEPGLTNSKLIDKIKTWHLGDSVVYCDSASPERIAELKAAGINAKKAYKGKNSVKDGIDFIKRSKLYITSSSVNILKEISGYTYKQERDGTVLDEPVKFNDHACFIAGTKIDTINGKVNIEDIETGELVLTSDGYKEVIDSQCTGVKEVKTYSIKGNTLTMTPDHRIITNKGKVSVKDLTNDHTLFIKEDITCQKKLVLTELPIEDIQTQTDEVTEFITGAPVNILNTALVSYTETNTGSTTEKYQKDTISTIKIQTLLTMILKTWKQLMNTNTYLHTPKTITRGIERMYLYILKQLGRLQKNGIKVKMAINGTPHITKSLLEIYHYLLQYVKNVVMFTPLKYQESFAAINVSQLTEEDQKLIMKQDFVPNAAKNFQLTNIQKQCAAHINVPHNSDGIKTYNITVKDKHEYFANNVLVSNCDAIRYAIYTCWGRHKTYGAFI